MDGRLGRLNRETTDRALGWLKTRGVRPRLAVAGMLLCPPLAFLERYLLHAWFLRGGQGLADALLESSASFWAHAKWWHRSWTALGGGAGAPWPPRRTGGCA